MNLISLCACFWNRCDHILLFFFNIYLLFECSQQLHFLVWLFSIWDWWDTYWKDWNDSHWLQRTTNCAQSSSTAKHLDTCLNIDASMGLEHMFKIKQVLWALLHREALQHILKCFAELALQLPLLLATFFYFYGRKNKRSRSCFCYIEIKIYPALKGWIYFLFVHTKVYIHYNLFLKSRI